MFGLLIAATVILAVLKAAGVLALSWWFVAAPALVAVGYFIFVMFGIAALVVAAASKKNGRR